MTEQVNENEGLTPMENAQLRYAGLEKFRSDNGQLLTRRLFWEVSLQINDKSKTYYSLSNVDHPEGYPSLYKLYLQEEDPTEYRFASKYFEDYDHWMVVTRTPWMAPLINKWRKHLRSRLQSKAVGKILSISEDDTHKEQFKALLLVVKAGWEQPGSIRGRPSAEEIKKNLKIAAQDNDGTLDDYERIFNRDDSKLA